jgi:hypothetical protein
MIPATRITSLDRVAGGVILALLALIAAVILLGSRIGLRVKADFADREVGPLSPLTLTFSMPVNPEDVQPLLSLALQSAGRVEWLDSKTAQFFPDSPLEPGRIYELRLNAGTIGEEGELLRNDQTWPFSIRSPSIVYQAFPENRSEIWITDKEGTTPHRLVETDLRIYDFDASPNGEFIAYSAYNEQNGLDLWIVNRDGVAPVKLLDCGAGRCTTPSISPESTRLAYTREAPGLTPNDAPGAPRIYMLDLKDRQDGPLFEDSQILGYSPLWSPDGKWVSSFDGLQDEIRVVSLETGKQVLLPSVIGSYLSWSPDSNQLAFIDADDTLNGLRTIINIADFRTGQVKNLLGQRDVFDFGYGALAWSPVEQDQLIIGMRPLPDDPSHGLWLIDIDTIGGTTVAYKRDITYQTPRWDLWGRAILFQQFRLGEAAQPQISFWESGMDEPRIVADGLSPSWLP